MGFLSHWDLHLLHPKVVHFPIALFLSAVGIEALSLIFKNDSMHRSAWHLYVLAVMLTPFVVLTGLNEANHLKLHHPVLDLHQRFAFLTMYGSGISFVILKIIQRKKPVIFRFAFLAVVFITAIFVSTAAYYGGEMVYEYGVGVEG